MHMAITADEMVRRLDAQARPLGHEVVADGDRLRVRPRGAGDHHPCQFVANDPHEVAAYLTRRSSRLWWTLDVEDPRYRVEASPDQASVVLIDQETGCRQVVAGPVTEAQREVDTWGRVTTFRIQRRSAPPVGRWYR